MSKSDLWDRRYNVEDFVYGTEPNAFLRSVTPKLSPGKTLCIGEGEGRNAVYLASEGHDVTAVDFSAIGLSKLRRLAEERGETVTTLLADLADFDFGAERWDNVVSIFCHLDRPMRRNIHRKTVRALRASGHFVLEAYTPEQLRYGTGGPPTVELLITLEELERDFGSLQIQVGQELVRDVHEGKLHNGSAAVVQFLGRKPS